MEKSLGLKPAFGALAKLNGLLDWRERRLLREMEAKLRRLAEWPHAIPSDEVALVREALSSIRHVFRARRAVMLWELADEPYLNVAAADGDQFAVSQEPPERFDPPVAPALDERDFFVAARSPAKVLTATMEREEIGSPVLHPDLVSRFGIESALGIRFSSEGMQGIVLILDLSRVGRADFAIGRYAAEQIVARAEQMAQMSLVRAEGVSEERFRVARDLHDGLLQSFTGTVLQLETVHDLLDKDPMEARRRLTQVEATIMHDQREMRAYVDELRPRKRRHSTEFDLRGRLDELRERFAREWRIELTVELGPMHPLVTQALGQETFRMISEAVTNSARHGQASRIEVHLGTREDRLWIRVRDDGIGFPFRGRYNLAALQEKQQGPLVLGERIAALNGELNIVSTEEGATLEILLPLGWRAEG